MSWNSKTTRKGQNETARKAWHYLLFVLKISLITEWILGKIWTKNIRLMLPWVLFSICSCITAQSIDLSIKGCILLCSSQVIPAILETAFSCPITNWCKTLQKSKGAFPTVPGSCGTILSARKQNTGWAQVGASIQKRLQKPLSPFWDSSLKSCQLSLKLLQDSKCLVFIHSSEGHGKESQRALQQTPDTLPLGEHNLNYFTKMPDNLMLSGKQY